MIFEWPRHCDGWRPEVMPHIKHILRYLPHRADVDGCTMGVCDRRGLPLQKKWRMQTSDLGTARRLISVCPRDHPHGDWWHFGNASATGFYSRLMVRWILNAAGMRKNTKVSQCCPADVEVPAPDSVMDALPVTEGEAIKKAVKTLHTNAGHPSNQHLARAIRLAGGSDAAIHWALNYKCAVCLRLMEPTPSLPSNLRGK